MTYFMAIEIATSMLTNTIMSIVYKLYIIYNAAECIGAEMNIKLKYRLAIEILYKIIFYVTHYILINADSDNIYWIFVFAHNS